MIHITVPADELEETAKRGTSNGYGIACMYVVEQSDVKRSIETIMISGDDVMRISAFLDEGTFRSLTPEIPAANIYEREIKEMSNVLPMGHTDLRPLKQRSESENAYPMQKAPYEPAFIRRVSIPRNGMIGEGLFEIPVGPIHAGVIEPGHFRFSVAGEPILMMRAYLGYAHRGIEKIMESYSPDGCIRIAERISGDNSIAHSLAYLQAVENDAEIPERALYVRMIFAELERIHNLLGGISGIALDTALAVPAAKGYALKERIMRLNARVSGHRFLRGVLKAGGLRRNVTDESLKDIGAEMVRLKFEIDGLFDTIVSSASFMDRAENTGVLSEEDAVRTRAVGPVARASGIEYDVRRNHPYALYGDIGMKVSTHTSGDVYARFKVKKNEILESISIITQCIDRCDNGKISCSVETKDGFSMGMTESPRGELIHCIHIVNGKIWRYKIRDPSVPNWTALECAVMGNIVPDFPLINKSFDLSYSGNDL